MHTTAQQIRNWIIALEIGKNYSQLSSRQFLWLTRAADRLWKIPRKDKVAIKNIIYGVKLLAGFLLAKMRDKSVSLS
jgi:hypothetical protein